MTDRAQAVVLVGSDRLGEGEEELGRILMRAFVKNLAAAAELPAQAIFVNAGVRLTTEGSPLLADLRALEARGVEVVSCGTCLDYYHLKDKLAVGRPTTMAETVAALLGAASVVRV